MLNKKRQEKSGLHNLSRSRSDPNLEVLPFFTLRAPCVISQLLANDLVLYNDLTM